MSKLTPRNWTHSRELEIPDSPIDDLKITKWANEDYTISLLLRTPHDEESDDPYIEIPVEDLPRVIAVLEQYVEREDD